MDLLFCQSVHGDGGRNIYGWAWACVETQMNEALIKVIGLAELGSFWNLIFMIVKNNVKTEGNKAHLVLWYQRTLPRNSPGFDSPDAHFSISLLLLILNFDTTSNLCCC